MDAKITFGLRQQQKDSFIDPEESVAMKVRSKVAIGEMTAIGIIAASKRLFLAAVPSKYPKIVQPKQPVVSCSLVIGIVCYHSKLLVSGRQDRKTPNRCGKLHTLFGNLHPLNPAIRRKTDKCKHCATKMHHNK